MSDAAKGEASGTSAIDRWLLPFPDAALPCGLDLEYDDEFRELLRAAHGKPESQFSVGEPPNWRVVREKAESLLLRTRDLRVAVYWTRASVNLNGFSGLSAGLQLVQGLLANFWEHLHPLPDEDGDQFARANSLSLLSHADGLYGDLRRAVLFSARGVGELRLRSVSIAYGQATAMPNEISYTKDQLAQLVATAASEDPLLPQQPRVALLNAQLLASNIRERFDAVTAPDLNPLLDLIKLVVGLMPDASAESKGEVVKGESTEAGFNSVGSAGDKITSRADALRAINQVCEYLEHTEPSNPAQILLRRAARLIDQNFLQLIKELAPDALNEAARILGVDPSTVAPSNLA